MPGIGLALLAFIGASVTMPVWGSMWREVCCRSSLTPAGLHGESSRIRETSARFQFAGSLSQGDPPSEPWRVSKATRIICVSIGLIGGEFKGFDASVNSKVSNCPASAIPVLQMYDYAGQEFIESEYSVFKWSEIASWFIVRLIFPAQYGFSVNQGV